MKVEQLMRKDVRTCTPDDSLDRAAQLMWEQDCGCAPVVAPDGSARVVGMITDRDICMAAYTQGALLRDLRVGDAMSHKVIGCQAGDSIGDAEAIMAEARVRRLPVLDDGGQLQGLISLADIACEAERARSSRQRRPVKADEVGRTLAAVCRPGAAAEG